MESYFWDSLVRIRLVEDKFTTEIAVLQTIHDKNRDDSIEFLKTELTKFAQRYNLQVNFES